MFLFHPRNSMIFDDKKCEISESLSILRNISIRKNLHGKIVFERSCSLPKKLLKIYLTRIGIQSYFSTEKYRLEYRHEPEPYVN